MPRHDRLTFIPFFAKHSSPPQDDAESPHIGLLDDILTALDENKSIAELQKDVRDRLTVIVTRSERDAQLRTLLAFSDILNGSRNPAMALATLQSEVTNGADTTIKSKIDIAIAKRFKVSRSAVSQARSKWRELLASHAPTRDRKPSKQTAIVQVPIPRTSSE